MKKSKIFSCIFAAVISVFIFGSFACFAEEAETSDESGELFTLEDFHHLRIGIQEGSLFEPLVDIWYPDAVKIEYKNRTDLTLALTQGKIDGFLANLPGGQYTVLNTEGIYIVDGDDGIIQTESYGFIFAKNGDGDRLRAEVDEFIRKIRTDGTLEEIEDIWFGADESKKVVDLENFSGENGTVSMATSSGQAPMAYVKDGKLVGYDVDIAARFCREYGYKLDASDMEFSSIIAGVCTGKYNFGTGCITITEERAQSVNFSEPTFVGGDVMLAYNSKAVKQVSIFEKLATSFDRTFIQENRWQLILQGILTTITISVFAAIGGTVLGFGTCLMKRSANKILNGIAVVYIRLLQGTPIVVFLMITYYVIFAKSDIQPMWVAVIAFSLNFGAYAAEIMRTGIEAVDNGQIEAAKAIGFTPVQTFAKVVMPQAARHFLPVYKGELISLLKSTSVVGYIAVQDLTKMSDIIRSRTYEAFFPLIASAVIYFILAYLLSLALNAVMKQVGPNLRKRTVKGVVMK